MNKHSFFIVLLALLSSVLFYQQGAGINYLLFSIPFIALFLYFFPGSVRKPLWWLHLLAVLISAGAVFIINSNLSVFTFIICLLLFSAQQLSPSLSFISSFITAVFSVITTPPAWLIRKITEPSSRNTKSNSKYLFSFFLALGIAVVFLLLYQHSNPLFSYYLQQLDLSFISLPWLLFMVLSIFILRSLMKMGLIDCFPEWEVSFLKNITAPESEKNPESQESFIALILFILLNFMLLFINLLDIKNIYIHGHLPEGITLSDFVHQAVRSIFISTVLAIGLILWFFRSELNFSGKGKQVRLVVYLWLFQSAFMILNTLIRNTWYIQEFQFTYKRIGVYVFLALCLIGLFLCFFKLRYHKSSWWLISTQFATVFLCLVVTTLINWDVHIARYNLSHAGITKRPDITYLLSLSDACIPDLVDTYMKREIRFTEKEKALFEKKIRAYYERNWVISWQSYNLRQEINRKKLNELVFQKDHR